MSARATVDEDVGAGHEARSSTGDKRHDVGDLFGSSEPTEWILAENRFIELGIIDFGSVPDAAGEPMTP